MDFDISFKGQSIYIAVYVHAISILNNILKFRNIVQNTNIGRATCRPRFVPLTSSHISLARLEGDIFNEATSVKLKNTFKSLVKEFRNKGLTCRPTEYYLGFNSVRIYFDSDTVNMLDELRYSIIHHATENGLQYCDDRKFVPHITVIRRFVDADRNALSECISIINRGYIPSFIIPKLSILGPELILSSLDREIISKSKEFSADFD